MKQSGQTDRQTHTEHYNIDFIIDLRQCMIKFSSINSICWSKTSLSSGSSLIVYLNWLLLSIWCWSYFWRIYQKTYYYTKRELKIF